jgi:hydroxymethylglutaryl-CoA lyase
MADAEALAARTSGSTIPTRWALVLNPRGAERALACGLRNLQFVVSVSERHSLENAGRTPGQALAELDDLVALSRSEGANVEVTLSTAFGCPFSGPVPPDQVLATVDRALEAGVSGIGLADTIGTAVPTEVRSLVGEAVKRAGQIPIGIHLHDTRGLAIANALTALEAGAVRVDGAVGGLGGCPFAPGASGNLALEDLACGLEAMGVTTGLDLDRLIAASRLACRLVGRQVGSHVGNAGRRYANTPFGAASSKVAS